MKAKGFVLAVIVCLFFNSCFSGFFEDKKESIVGEEDMYTVIVPVTQGRVNLRNNFNATNGHAVNVYLSYDKQKPLATVPARGSIIVPVNPNPMQHFYFTYLLKIISSGKEINIGYTPTNDYGGGAVIVPITESTQPTPVIIPSIHDLIVNAGKPERLSLPLVDDIYFLIRNNTSFTINFCIGGQSQNSIDENDIYHTGDSTRVYRTSQTNSINSDATFIRSGSNSYLLNTNSDETTPDPDDKVTFQAGYLYEIEYSTGGIIKVTRKIPINIENTSSFFERRSITFNANGGQGFAPQTLDNLVPGVEIELPGQGLLSRTGFSFGGWNENTQGSSTNYTTSIVVPDRNLLLYARWLALLGVPINVYGTPSSNSPSNSVSLTWSSVSGATGYVVYCYLNSDDPQFFKREVVTGNTTNRTITGLQSETMYYFRVAATNSNGEEGAQSEISLPVRTTTSSG